MEPVDLIAPLSFVLGGLLLGLLFDRFVLSRIRDRLSGRRRIWDVVARSLRGLVPLWFAIGGLYLALSRLDLEPGVAGVLRNVVLAALIFSVALVVARIVGDLVDAYTTSVEGLPSTSLLPAIARLVVLALGVLVVLQSLGVAISPLLAGLGIGGLAVALALQDPLSNLLSGVFIIVSKQLRPGEFVSLGPDQQGYVRDINWRNTTIRNLDGDLMIVPNTTLIADTITNHHRPMKETRVLVPMRVSPGSDLARVEEVTLEVAKGVMKEVEGGIPSFEPLVRYNADGLMGTDFNVIMRAREYTDKFLVTHEFVKRLDERYRREGIKVPYATAYAASPDGSGTAGNA